MRHVTLLSLSVVLLGGGVAGATAERQVPAPGHGGSVASQPAGPEPRERILELRIRDLEDQIELRTRSLEEEVAALKQVVTRVGAWEPFGTDITRIVEDGVNYEYGCMRNGGFRTLTASTWNAG